MTKNNDCQDRHDAIAALVLGELEGPAADEIRQHMNACPNCRALHQALKEEEEIVRSAFKVIDQRSKVIEDNLVAQFGKDSRVKEDDIGALPESQKTKQAHTELSKWATIMKGKTAKLAAAAVILIGVLILIRFFVGTNKSVVLAGVLEKVEQVRAYSYKMKMTFSERTNPEKPMTQKIEGTITISNEYGTKLEMHSIWETNKGLSKPDRSKTTTKLRYVLPNQKLDVLIKPEQKKYRRTELDDDSLARMKEENDGPREMMRQILECEYTKTGRTVIDGIEVEGFETTDPKFAAGKVQNFEDVRVKLWVDVDTWLPVLWETDTTINDQMSLHTVFYDFQWDIPVVASDFEPVIPDDYTPINTYELPSKFEEEAFEGLRFFVEIFGCYPEKIDMSLAQKFSDPYFLLNREYLTDAYLKLKEELESLDPEQRIQKAIDMSKPFASISVFYKMLVDTHKDPAYYGPEVGPEDADAVLLRWKVSENEYRIIFGDLSRKNATAEELANLEQ